MKITLRTKRTHSYAEEFDENYGPNVPAYSEDTDDGEFRVSVSDGEPFEYGEDDLKPQEVVYERAAPAPIQTYQLQPLHPQQDVNDTSVPHELQWIVRLINHALLCLLQKDESRSIKISRRKSTPLQGMSKGSGIWLLHMVQVEEERFKCVLPTCSKTFKTLPSIKYHLNTYKHSIPEFLCWAFYGEGSPYCRVGINVNDLPETMEQFLEKAPAEASGDVDSDPIYYVWPGTETAQEAPILFDAKTFVKGVQVSFGNVAHVQPPVNPGQTAIAAPVQMVPVGSYQPQLTQEEQHIVNLINVSVESLLVPVERRPASNRSTATNAPEDRVINFKPEEDSEKFKCALPTCSKIFKTQMSFKYHMQHYNHDLTAFLKHVFAGEGAEAFKSFVETNGVNDVGFPKSVADLDVLLADPTLFVYQSSIPANTVFYHWPGQEYAYDCTFLFEVPRESVKLKSPNMTTLTTKQASALPITCPPVMNRASSTLPSIGVLPLLLPAKDSIKFLSAEQAKEYLPIDKSWHVQHFAARKSLSSYDFSTGSCRVLPEECKRRGFILNAGGCVFTNEWCPDVPPEHNSWIAVGGSNDVSIEFTIGSRTVSTKGCIQLWQVPKDILNVTEKMENLDSLKPELKIVICHEFGTVFDLRWVPTGCYQTAEESDFPRIGVFAATFHDGSIRAFAVPHYECLKKLATEKSIIGDTLYITMNPVFSSVSKEGTFTRVNWKVEGEKVLLATGTAAGEVIVFDLSSLFDASGAENIFYPLMAKREHQFFLRSIAWSDNPEHGRKFVTSGYDGKLVISNADNFQDTESLRKHTGFLTDVLWRSQFDGILYACSDNCVRIIPDTDHQRSSLVIVHKSGIWSLDATKHHTFVASSASDGCVQICNIIRNRAKECRNVQVPIYRVVYEYSNPNNIVFCENEPVNDAVYSKQDMQLWPLECIVYSTRFHPEDYACTWLVSGGRSGIVRIETCYREKDQNVGR
ncbi:hypothetical protein MP638_006272 [Amoeboaphelidium occidentale]|nr:hypothetical protein MP638_006272 [Amoeboaphelidium occidentale]